MWANASARRILLAAAVVLAGCGGASEARRSDFAALTPEDVETWERVDVTLDRSGTQVGPGMRDRELFAATCAEHRELIERVSVRGFPDERVRALGWLRECGDPRSVAAVEMSSHHEDRNVRSIAVDALARFASSTGQAPRGLVDAMRDPEEAIRVPAACALVGHRAHREEAVQLLARHLREPDGFFRAMAVQSLAFGGAPATRAAISVLFDETVPLRARREAAWLLRRLDDPEHPHVVDEALVRASRFRPAELAVTAVAVRAFRRDAPERALRDLVLLTDSPDPEVRRAAYDGLMQPLRDEGYPVFGSTEDDLRRSALGAFQVAALSCQHAAPALEQIASTSTEPARRAWAQQALEILAEP